MPSTKPWRPRPARFPRLCRRPLTLAAALLALTAFIVPASTATAASIDAECLGSFSRTFAPAITLAPQTVTVTEASNYSLCAVPVAVGATATGTETLTLSLGCIPVTAGPAATETLTWHDATGGTSTINWLAPTIVGQTVVFNGTVTAGRHNNDAATKVTSGLSYFASVLGCVLFGTPVSSTSGLVDSLLFTH
ncbi:MAG TPA: hypothetical protein VGO80_11150 [Solirubrobacteraceae bacterium]|jgi:hypothetical protein|nr:hypothetical protein [Solirubrobacteraceae bacterium]